MPLSDEIKQEGAAYPATVRVELVLNVLNVDIMSSAPAGLPYKSPPAESPYLHHTDAASDPPRKAQQERNLRKATESGDKEHLPNLTNSAYSFYTCMKSVIVFIPLLS